MRTALPARLQKPYSGAAHDVLRSIGHSNCVLPINIRPLDSALKVAGSVWTVSGRMDRTQSRRSTLLGWTTLLSKTSAGHVVVCQPNNHEVGLMGDLSAQALKHKGVLAYVVDGGCRDCDFILEQKFAVFHIFFTPIDIVARWILDHCEQAVTQGKVAISTGHYLLCDWDGVVVTPKELVQTVVTQTEAVAMAENQVRAPILDGMDPVEAYLKYGKF